MNILDLLKSSKPKVVVDPSFKQGLYERLIAGKQKTINHDRNLNFMNRFKFVLPAAALGVIAIVLAVTVPRDQKTTLVGSKQEITRLSANAFGQINALNTAAGGQGGGGSGNNFAADSKMAAPSGTESAVGMGGGGSALTMPYYPTFYKYVYKGDAFEVEQDQMDVYEREKGFGSSAEFGSFLERFDVGLFNVNKFQNALIDNIAASENRSEGYSLNIDFRQGSMYINQNWEKWPMIDYSSQVSPDQIPADEAAISTANAFLDEYGISRENYGTPEVQNSWRIMYERASADVRSSLYVPDMVSVVYPAKISGNEVYDESGNKTGMYVHINVRTNKISSVGEITGQRYSASAYPTEKDSSRLVKIAESGGFRSYMPFAEGSLPPDTKTVEVELGNPTISYVRMWHTLNNQSKDIYVPALVFPIINQPADMYQKSITVPLIKELLDSQDNQPKPMPADLPLGTPETKSAR